MIDSRLAMYHKGAITADHFILMSLNMVDPKSSASSSPRSQRNSLSGCLRSLAAIVRGT